MNYLRLSRWIRTTDLSPSERLLLVFMGLRTDDAGKTFAGRELLARDTGLSVRQVGRLIRSLEAKGIITAQRRKGTSSLYQVKPPWPDVETPCPDKVGPPGPDSQDTMSSDLPREELPRSLSRAPARPRVKDTRLPEDWTLPAELATWAQSQGLTSDEVASEAERFRDYYLGRGAVRADWGATWRSWVRRRDEFKRSPPKKREQRPDVNPLADYEAQIAAERGPRKGGPTPEQLASFDIEAARRKLHAELGLPMQVGAA